MTKYSDRTKRRRLLLLAGRSVGVAAVVLAGFAQTAHAQTQYADWPRYNNGYDGHRFSPLTQINPGNVNRLGAVCELGVGEAGPFQAGPLMVGDTLYVTTSHTTLAMDATNCAVRWRAIDSKGLQDPLSVDRGVAYLDGKLYRGMPGARLAALDAATGRTLWDVKIGDPSAGEFVSAAPVAWDGMIFVGLAGSDWGIRGRMMAFDAATGKELWRFNTIPMGKERGADTWRTPGSANHGGGGTWTTYSLDTATGELFVPIGNPGPDFNPSVRVGDNLFTNSVVVLDAKSGGLQWWYQATPADGYDYDIAAAPVLYGSGGQGRMAIGSKDGHLYGVDRSSHKLVFRTPITTIHTPPGPPTSQGVYACPGPLGGVEWNGPALDPASNTLYVGSVDWCATEKSGEPVYKAGDMYMGTDETGDPNEKATGWVTAVDGATGAVKWKYNTPKPVTAGVTPTASGLLFTGDMAGNFYAFDRSTGKVLVSRDMGGALAGGVVTYMVGGRQYVAFTSGNVSRALWGTEGNPKVVVTALDAAPAAVASISLPEVNANGLASAQSSAALGQQKFGQFCSSCHGATGAGGGGGPNLKTASLTDRAAIAAFVKKPPAPMPKLYPSPLSDADVTVIADYVVSLQNGK